MATRGLLDIEVRYLDERASPVIGRLAEVDPDLIVTGRPVRRFPVYKNQSNYPGWLWSSTMGRLIGYESLLERDRVWLADFDPAVQAIASQPFWMSGRDGTVLRRHVPDFLLKTSTGFVVVDVKPERMLADAHAAQILKWAGSACAARGWQFEVWTGANPVLLRNVRFLAAGRRELVDPEVLRTVVERLHEGMSIAEAEAASRLDPQVARGALLTLIWRGTWVTDLTEPLSPKSVLTRGVQAA